MLAPEPEAPLDRRMQLSVRSRPRYVRGAETDLVLDFEGKALKISAALRHLPYLAEYEFDLEWPAGAYRVARVRLDGQSLLPDALTRPEAAQAEAIGDDGDAGKRHGCRGYHGR